MRDLDTIDSELRLQLCAAQSASTVGSRRVARSMNCSTTAERRLVRQIGDDRRDVRRWLQAEECAAPTPLCQLSKGAATGR